MNAGEEMSGRPSRADWAESAHGHEATESEAMRLAVAEGLHDAVGSPKFWARASAGMAEHAQAKAGSWLWRMLRGTVERLLWVVIGVALVYHLGGWPAVVALLKGQSVTGIK